MIKKLILLICMSMLISQNTLAENSDEEIKADCYKNPISLKALIIPSALVLYGFIGIESDELKFTNSEIKEEVNEHIDEKVTIDDFSQYLPFLAVYGINAVGNRGKNNLMDRTVILGTSYLLMGSMVLSLKYLINIERPDGSSHNSFPSGHTATAFMGAEFLYQEFKEESIWFGISGYAIASGTGFFRIFNDRHWFTDVTAGAGLGMLSTKFAYWLNSQWFEKSENSKSVFLFPFSDGKDLGMKFGLHF